MPGVPLAFPRREMSLGLFIATYLLALGMHTGQHMKGNIMKAEFTAIIEAAPEGGYWAICPEIPGANGQGETIEETKNSLREAIELILEDRRADEFLAPEGRCSL